MGVSRKNNPNYKAKTGVYKTKEGKKIRKTVYVKVHDNLNVTVLPKNKPNIDIDSIIKNIEEGNISKREWAGLSILNYTPKAQYERIWNPSTTICRGLIVDKNWNIVARPFPKFYNLGEHEQNNDAQRFYNNSFECLEKMDGSLGIVFRHPETGELRVSTRGSIQSDQAIWATNWLQRNSSLIDFDENTTPLVEIIYPENRIVVNYGSQENLVFLDAIDNKTGNDSTEYFWGGDYAGKFVVNSLQELIDNGPLEDDGNNEGYVLKYNFNRKVERIKVKLEEYVKLHRILTGLTSKRIWEILATGKDLEYIKAQAPDEVYDWIDEVSNGILIQKETIENEAINTYLEILDKLPDGFEKKDYAKLAIKSDKSPLLFTLFDHQTLDTPRAQESIWKMVRPETSEPIKGID